MLLGEIKPDWSRSIRGLDAQSSINGGVRLEICLVQYPLDENGRNLEFEGYKEMDFHRNLLNHLGICESGDAETLQWKDVTTPVRAGHPVIRVDG
jgi:hypothetical protein